MTIFNIHICTYIKFKWWWLIHPWNTSESVYWNEWMNEWNKLILTPTINSFEILTANQMFQTTICEFSFQIHFHSFQTSSNLISLIIFLWSISMVVIFWMNLINWFDFSVNPIFFIIIISPIYQTSFIQLIIVWS